MYKFRHFLNFLDLPQIGTIEISEPFGFDGSSFKVEQDNKRFGRDVYKANEEIELEFTREEFEKLNGTQTLPDGTQINHASQGWDWLIQLFDLYGWESRVEYILDKDGVTFTQGIFDYFTMIIGNDSIKFKIIQDTKRELTKRREDVDIDAFNDEDVDGNTITPCATTNILLKAKPIAQNSEWILPDETSATFVKPPLAANTKIIFNYINQTVTYNIENSLSYIQGGGAATTSGGYSNIAENFIYISAANNLNSVNASFQYSIKLSAIQVPLQPTKTLNGTQLKSYYYKGATFSYADRVLLNSQNLSGIEFTTTKSLTLQTNLLIGEKFWFWLEFNPLDSVNSDAYKVDFLSGSVVVDAISQGIDSVIKGVRLIDLIKHNANSISGLNVVAPAFESGGEFYDTFAFNGYLIGQITDKGFKNKFKDLMDIMPEFFHDYQINPTEIEILPYQDYYKDVQMASFNELSDSENTTIFNKRYFLSTADIGFKNSSKDRETNGQNSIDDVHGKSQWMFPNQKADGNLKIDLNQIRSAFLIEQARREAVNSKTTSLQNDDKLFLMDCVTIAPSTQGGFGAVLLMNETETGHLQILNNNSAGDLGTFSWDLLGFSVGSQFIIASGENVGTWQVFSITPTVLELFPITTSVSFTGEAFIQVSYFFTNVNYTIRTNEGFAFIDGVENPTNYGNLSASIKRIINRWLPYFATATKYVQGKQIKNTSFEPNENLITRLFSESTNVVDIDPINTSDIASLKILNPIIHNVSVFCEYEDAVQLINDVETLKGYVSVLLNNGKLLKGYIKEMDYEWVTGKLDLILEEKFESDFMTITEVSGVIYINEVGKPQAIGLTNFEVNGEFVVLVNNDTAINGPIHYSKIKVNGVAYSNLVDFTDALQNLIE